MLDTVLHLYEFNPGEFTLQDDIAGYYVSSSVQIPVAEYEIKNPLQALIDRGVEVRFTDRLWEAAGEVKASTLNLSLIHISGAAGDRICRSILTAWLSAIRRMAG